MTLVSPLGRLPFMSDIINGGIVSMMRPGTVRTVGRVAPRVNNFKPSIIRPVPSTPVPMPISTYEERVIPDAGLPTEFVEGFLILPPMATVI